MFQEANFSKITVAEQLLEIFKYGVSSVQLTNILDNLIKLKIKKYLSGNFKKIYSNVQSDSICIGASVDMAK